MVTTANTAPHFDVSIDEKKSKMTQVKKKLSATQKRARRESKAERQRKYEWVFMNGKQVRIKRPPTIDGIPIDEYIEKYADPIWLHQNGYHEILHARENEEYVECNDGDDGLF